MAAGEVSAQTETRVLVAWEVLGMARAAAGVKAAGGQIEKYERQKKRDPSTGECSRKEGVADEKKEIRGGRAENAGEVNRSQESQ